MRVNAMTDEATANNPYAAVLADLERERDQINATIAMIRRRMGLATDEPLPPAAPGVGGVVSAPESSEVRPDSFIGMSIREAITKYLSMVKRPKKTADIARSLEQGGLQHFSKRWFATVQTTLNRMTVSGEVVRVPNGWGLLEWYRGRNFEKKPPPKAKKRAKKAKRKGEPQEKPGTVPDSRQSSLQQQGHYLNLLKRVPEERRHIYKNMTKQEGRDKAIKAMARDLKVE